MEHKDLWLVLGLTVILAVAVSLSTVSLTGNAIFGKVTKATTVQKAPTIKNIDLPVTYDGVKDMLNKCTGGGPSYVISETPLNCNMLCDDKSYMAPQKGKKCVFGLLKTNTYIAGKNPGEGKYTFNDMTLVDCDRSLTTTELDPDHIPGLQFYVQCRCC